MATGQKRPRLEVGQQVEGVGSNPGLRIAFWILEPNAEKEKNLQ